MVCAVFVLVDGVLWLSLWINRVVAENIVPYLYLTTQRTTSHRLYKIEALRSLLIAEELWRVSLLKYYTPKGKHRSAHATIMAPHSSCRLTHRHRMFVFGP